MDVCGTFGKAKGRQNPLKALKIVANLTFGMIWEA